MTTRSFILIYVVYHLSQNFPPSARGRVLSARIVVYNVYQLLLDEIFTAEDEGNCWIKQAPRGSQFLSPHEPFHYCIQDTLSSRALGLVAECAREQKYIAYNFH